MKAFKGKKEDVLGLKCLVMDYDKEMVEAYIIGYEAGKYLVRVAETGCIRRLRNIFFKEEMA